MPIAEATWCAPGPGVPSRAAGKRGAVPNDEVGAVERSEAKEPAKPEEAIGLTSEEDGLCGAGRR